MWREEALPIPDHPAAPQYEAGALSTAAAEPVPEREARAAEDARSTSRPHALGLLTVLALAAALRVWRLGDHGLGTDYYAAAVRSMLASWHNLLYNAFDPAGFVSLDKPPVALWLQVGSARLLGFNGLALHLPQVLEGVGAVWLTHHLVRRAFGPPAALIAALGVALAPISVATDRSTNTDSCLVLVLLLAAAALLGPAETLVGVAFNVKMLAAFVVLPTFAAVYLLGAPSWWRRRVVDLALGGIVLALVSLSWTASFDLTAPERRPFAGGTRTNSMLELAVGHNGLERFAARQPRSARAATAPDPTAPSGPAGGRPSVGGPRVILGFGDRTPPGAWRLFHPHLASQVAWLLPLAVLGLLLGPRWREEAGEPPRDAARLSLALWLGWALTYWIVYSATSGIFHSYYLSTIAPPLAALAGVGLTEAWRWHRRGGWRALALPLGLAATAAWQCHVEAGAVVPATDARGPLAALVATISGTTEWRAWLQAGLLEGTLLAVAALLALALLPGPLRAARAPAAAAAALGLAALLVLPAAWSLSSVLDRGNLMLPSANLNRLTRAEPVSDLRDAGRQAAAARMDALLAFLRANRRGERYLLATPSAVPAAPIIARTGEPVMAMGGFHGEDPILTPERLRRLVDDGQLRFVLVGEEAGFGWRPGGEAANRDVADWIRANGAAVEAEYWRPPGRGPGGRRGSARLDLYDLRPALGLVKPIARS
jgi:4-amino-4-deoxy-L-arabinose transferase-like glycosyltransferase